MKRVLVVDDEAHVIRVLQLSFERAGYRVDTARNGEEALRRICESEPDAMLADIQMPRMDGRELCRRIQEVLPSRGFPILVMTSSVEAEHREWVASMPGVEFVEKPLSVRKILERVGALVGGAPPENEA
ncbi:MAG: response regulator [Deltaproteobacteria bacterium]|nr:response regulator [Deltaproteobacteria bacterium]